MNDKVELGDEVADKISGFRGIVYGLAKCLTGCDRADIRPGKLDKDGKLAEGYWFDVHQLKILKKQKVPYQSVQAPESKPKRKVGGPPMKSSRYY